jgi:hypothetical protein
MTNSNSFPDLHISDTGLPTVAANDPDYADASAALNEAESSLGLAFIRNVGTIVSADPGFYKLLHAAANDAGTSSAESIESDFSAAIGELRKPAR